MQTPDKFTRITALVAKILVRLFFILLLVALTLVVQFKDSPGKLGYFNPYQWQIIAPILLIAGFIILLVICTVKKYRLADLNLLLIVNSAMLIAYGVVLFLRLSQMVK